MRDLFERPLLPLPEREPAPVAEPAPIEAAGPEDHPCSECGTPFASFGVRPPAARKLPYTWFCGACVPKRGE